MNIRIKIRVRHRDADYVSMLVPRMQAPEQHLINNQPPKSREGFRIEERVRLGPEVDLYDATTYMRSMVAHQTSVLDYFRWQLVCLGEATIDRMADGGGLTVVRIENHTIEQASGTLLELGAHIDHMMFDGSDSHSSMNNYWLFMNSLTASQLIQDWEAFDGINVRSPLAVRDWLPHNVTLALTDEGYRENDNSSDFYRYVPDGIVTLAPQGPSVCNLHSYRPFGGVIEEAGLNAPDSDYWLRIGEWLDAWWPHDAVPEPVRSWRFDMEPTES